METLRIRLFLALILAFLVAGYPAPALAHSALVTTNPAPNSNVETGPRLIKLGFTTPFLFLNDTYQAELQLESPSGQILTPRCSTAEIRTLLSIYDLEQPGKYRVSWRAVSVDGHVIGGSHLFSASSTKSGLKSIDAICAELGLEPGQVKKSSSQKFDDTDLEITPWLGFGLLAILLCFLAIRFFRNNS
jgi:methionine-rich copper-binding protein CopC